jgi:hypothetical protein
MQLLNKVDSWKDREQKLILKENGQVYYISAKAAMSKAKHADKDIWHCIENGHYFYTLKDKE